MLKSDADLQIAGIKSEVKIEIYDT